MPTPHGTRGALAFSADDVRVVRRVLAEAPHPSGTARVAAPRAGAGPAAPPETLAENDVRLRLEAHMPAPRRLLPPRGPVLAGSPAEEPAQEPDTPSPAPAPATEPEEPRPQPGPRPASPRPAPARRTPTPAEIWPPHRRPAAPPRSRAA